MTMTGPHDSNSFDGDSRVNMSSSRNTGVARLTTFTNHLGCRPKATMNVSRYSPSGMTHNSGMGAMSVVRNSVTPSSRLDGTNARASHHSRSRQDGGGSGFFGARVGSGPGLVRSRRAQPAVRATRA